jgi:hypothetical protein
MVPVLAELPVSGNGRELPPSFTARIWLALLVAGAESKGRDHRIRRSRVDLTRCLPRPN